MNSQQSPFRVGRTRALLGAARTSGSIAAGSGAALSGVRATANDRILPPILRRQQMVRHHLSLVLERRVAYKCVPFMFHILTGPPREAPYGR